MVVGEYFAGVLPLNSAAESAKEEIPAALTGEFNTGARSVLETGSELLARGERKIGHGVLGATEAQQTIERPMSGRNPKERQGEKGQARSTGERSALGVPS